jgi:hypothetical protein
MVPVLIAVVVCAVLAFDASARVIVVSGSPRLMKSAAKAEVAGERQVAGERWVATKAILRDAATGKLRKPTDAETRDLVRTIRELTARAAAAPRRVVAADGETQALADEAPAQVLIARATADGQHETLCVQTFEEAADFLGLVRAGGNE